MKKLLFFPGDSLPPKLSRSYWLAKELSRYFKVFLIRWEEPRSKWWAKGKIAERSRLITSASTFFLSLFTKFKIQKAPKEFEGENLYLVRAPIALKGAMSKIFGELNARRLARKLNQISLAALNKRVGFDFAFHADLFLNCPPLKNIMTFSDAQDDFDEKNDSEKLLDFEKAYLKRSCRACHRSFAITKDTADHLHKITGAKFLILPNGADFETIRGVEPDELENLREKLGIAKNKIIVGYIGGEVWFDKDFVQRLAQLANKNHPNIHFLFAGNLPKIELPNITNLGLVSPSLIHIYYQLIDIGILAKDSKTDFLRNSHPLKIVQYSSARKPIISPELNCFSNFLPRNISFLKMDIHQWVEKIEQLASFKWDSKLEVFWDNYSWRAIGKKLYDYIIGEYI